MLFLFKCEWDSICSFWEPDAGANAAFTVPQSQLGALPANPPADAGDDCGFDYAPAVQVKSLDDLPEGLSGIRVEGREWAVYLHREHVSTVGATCAAAGEWLAQSGRTPTTGKMQMIERYGAEFDPRTGMGGCEVWIPVAAKS